MKKTYFELQIDETGSNKPGAENSLFNTIKEQFNTIEDLNKFLIDRYGKMPCKRKKIYISNKENKSEVVGFLHSFWNKDWSHNSKSWFQTDWVSIAEIQKTIINI